MEDVLGNCVKEFSERQYVCFSSLLEVVLVTKKVIVEWSVILLF